MRLRQSMTGQTLLLIARAIALFCPVAVAGAHTGAIDSPLSVSASSGAATTLAGPLLLDATGRALDAPWHATEDPHIVVFQTDDGWCTVTFDTTETPDLTVWARYEFIPVIKSWYPKIAAMLPSEGYLPPREMRVVFREHRHGVAGARGQRIACAARWFRKHMDYGARGVLVHEMTHVVQGYGRGDRERPPSWLSEGIATYMRRFVYEPEKRTAEIDPEDRPHVRYNDSYRVTANFLNWLTNHYDADIVPLLNAAAREGRYSKALWEERTGRTVEELEAEWKASLLGEPTLIR